MHDTKIAQQTRPEFTAGSPSFPAATGNIPVTELKTVDEALSLLQTNKDAWVTLDIDQRIAILDQIRVDLLAVEDQWIAVTLNAKGLKENSFGVNEEWVLVGALYRMLRVLRGSLVDIKRQGRPRIPGSVSVRLDGQVSVPVFPQTLFDRIVYQGVSGEVWMEPGVTSEDVTRGQAQAYRQDGTQGKVVVVLGAGNLGMLPIADFMHKLFVEKKVAVLKVNPVNDYIGPVIEDAFAALIGRGFFQMVYGGSDVGSYLCHHQAVDEIHMTGSDKTFDVIMFGTGADRASRKANRRPVVNKPMTGELGNVSPVIVVPGDWSEKDISAQAARISSWLAYNAGFNCITPRVIIQQKNWAHRDQIVRALGDALSELPTRKAYYPGANDRHGDIVKWHPEAELHGESSPDHLPWTLVPNTNPTNTNDICFRTEIFCGQISETALDAPTIPEFLDRAVEFANDTLWGNLAATLIVHPKSYRDPQVAAAIDQAVANLRYGWVCINIYPGITYTLRVSPHGAFPGNEIFDIQSGVGTVNNYLMLDKTQKSVFRAPFRNPREPTLYTTKNMGFGRDLARFEASPSLWNFSRLGLSLMRS